MPRLSAWFYTLLQFHVIFIILYTVNGMCLQMYCGDGRSSSMATLWFQAPEADVQSLFHDEYRECQLKSG